MAILFLKQMRKPRCRILLGKVQILSFTMGKLHREERRHYVRKESRKNYIYNGVVENRLKFLLDTFNVSLRAREYPKKVKESESCLFEENR